jgi:predicted amidohydrolase YtcJ
MERLGVYNSKNIEDGLPAVMAMYAKNGVTSVQDAGFLCIPEDVGLTALSAMEKQGKLTMRFFTSYIYWGKSVESPEQAVAKAKANRAKYTSDLIRAETFKMFCDGTVEAQSASMLQDYMPPGKGKGHPDMQLDDMLALGHLAAPEGFSVHNHAIGDAAITMALDFQKALGPIEGTKTIAHVQVPPPDGVRRFAEQDSFFQTTPVWFTEDPLSRRELGQERFMRQFPVGTLQRAGVKITFGSDCPVFPGAAAANPFYNIFCAVNRGSDKVWHLPGITTTDDFKLLPPASEALTAPQCVNAYTINAAEQVRAGGTIGSITTGKEADFVVLERDILTINPEDIKDVTVAATYFRGVCVYKAAP